MKWKIEKSDSLDDNLILFKEGKKYFIYSNRNPVEAGLKYYKSVYNGPGLYIIVGLGYFYHLLPFIENKEINRIIILEPDENLVELVKNTKLFELLEKDKRVTLITGKEKIKIFYKGVRGNYQFLFYDRINLITYPILERLLPEVYKKTKDVVNFSLSDLLRDGLTIGRFAKRWLLNFKRNLEGFFNAKNLDSLRGLYKGECIVAAAGPSLDKAIKEIKSLKKKDFFIIAVDAAVRPLILSGIVPDIIVSIDPQSYIRFHFIDIEDKICNIPVVLSPMSGYEVFKLFKKRYLYFTRHPLLQLVIGNDFLHSYILNFQSVSSLAVKIANIYGFNKIYLIGFDYAFSNYRSYAKETFFYRYILINSSKLRPFFTREIGFIYKKLPKDKSLLTPEILNVYRKELENLINKLKTQGQDVELFNLYSSGVKINGVKDISEMPDELKYKLVGEESNGKMKLDINNLINSEDIVINSLALYYRLIKGYSKEIAYKKARKLYNKIFLGLKVKLNGQHDKV